MTWKRRDLDCWDLLKWTGRGHDPYDLALSLNIHRRHLTPEQRRELIASVLKAKPEASNLSIAKQVKADDKTVASVRRELEGRSEIPNVENRTDTKGRKQPAKKKPSKTRPGPPVVSPAEGAPPPELSVTPVTDEAAAEAPVEVKPVEVEPFEAKPPAAKSLSTDDTGLLNFTARVLELLRLTDKRAAERFAKTAVKAVDLARLGRFLTDLADLIEKTKAPGKTPPPTLHRNLFGEDWRKLSLSELEYRIETIQTLAGKTVRTPAGHRFTGQQFNDAQWRQLNHMRERVKELGGAA